MDRATFINILKVLFLKFSSFIFLYPLAILISRQLGAEGYGIYGFVTALSAMLAVFCAFGSDQMIVREIAKKDEKEHDEKLAIAVSSTTFLSFCITIAIIAICCIVYWLHGDIAWAYVAAAIPMQVTRKALVGIGRGYGRVVSARFSEDIVQPASALGLVLLLDLQEMLNLSFLITAIAASYLISSVYCGFKLKDKSTLLVSTFSRNDMKLWMLTAIPFLGMTFSNTLIVYADRVMLGMLHSYTETGIYLVASRNASILMVCFGCIQFVVGPKIAKLNKDSKKQLQNMATLHVILLLALGSVVMVSLMFLSDFLLSLFGDDFVNSKDALFVLLISYFLMFMGGAPAQYLFMMGQSKIALKIIVAAMFINLFLNLILIPEYGAVGAAIATAVSLIFKTTIGSFILYSKSGLHSSIFGCLWLKFSR
jgi:O-antigen/teichoic acid export membrane protein